MPLSFPPLLDDATDPLQWPVPPYAWQRAPVPVNDAAQPCRVESHKGSVVGGEMLSFDPAGRKLTLRIGANGATGSVSFSKFRRLTLTTPLMPDPPIAGAAPRRVPTAAHERHYTLHLSGTGEPMTGRAAGHVEAPEGMYLFTPVDEDASLERVFVPRAAYARCEFGQTAEEVAARLWIAAPSELLAAIERQQHMAVRPLGQSLLALGLLTQRQLDLALARRTDDVPLGDALVATGTITPSDLRTALAHKMGYPLVDLMRFPVDPAASAKLTKALAISCRAVPLMLDGTRLIVAVDEPSRVADLQAIHAFAQLSVVVALAPQLQIMLALDRLSGSA
jgi:hypothetical protein